MVVPPPKLSVKVPPSPVTVTFWLGLSVTVPPISGTSVPARAPVSSTIQPPWEPRTLTLPARPGRASSAWATSDRDAVAAIGAVLWPLKLTMKEPENLPGGRS